MYLHIRNERVTGVHSDPFGDSFLHPGEFFVEYAGADAFAQIGKVYRDGELCESADLGGAWLVFRDARNRRIAEVRWLVERHGDEKLLGVETTLGESEFIAVLEYVQELRMLGERVVDPRGVVWPEKPGVRGRAS